MQTNDRKTTIKKSIKPVTITVTLTASRINENGTFSGFEIVKATGPNKTFKVSIPPQGGGSIYLKVLDMENLTVLADTNVGLASAPKAKLF